MHLNTFKLLLSLITVTIITSCQENEAKLATLLGTWRTETGPTHEEENSSQLYIFNRDGSFNTVTRIVKSDNENEVLGFNYRSEGMFIIKDDQLTLSFNAIYTSGNALMVTEINDLTFTEEKFVQEMKVSFRDMNSSLELTFPPCAPNENCVGSMKFYRVPSTD
jgi:hypothetical protein